MARQFNEMFLRNLKPTDKVQEVREDRGFGIKVYPTGAKIFFYKYHIEGRRVLLNLGKYPAVSLSEARRRHAAAEQIRAAGRDPAAEERAAQEQRDSAYTVTKLVAEYIEDHAKIFKERTWMADERLLRVEVLPQWGKRKAEDITKRDVTLLLQAIVKRGTPAMSNQVLKVTRKMFNFAVERDILPHTPFTGVKALAPNNKRERTLKDAELKTFWEKIDTAPTLGDDLRRALKLILVTAQRPGEVAGMHTSEIDGHWWTIPSERAKNKLPHRVYLTQTALDLIGPLKVKDEHGEHDRGYIFPCPHKAKIKAMDGHALPVAVRRSLKDPVKDAAGKPVSDEKGKPLTINHLGVAKFTPHDLRRTAATAMAEMGQMDEVIDAVLSHKKQGIISNYNIYKYDKEKQIALEAWERKLLPIISGKKKAAVVLPFARPA